MSKRLIGLFVLALSLPLAACDDSTSAADSGTLTLLLTDEPAHFEQAIVTIERVELVGDGQPLVLRDDPFTTDLLSLSNDVAELVGEETIPGGRYSEIRFIIPGACIEVENDDGSFSIYASDGFDDCEAERQGNPGQDGSLQLPSFAQTGIKVNLPGGSIEVDGDSRILLLDFDVSQSFGQQAGASGMWVMSPVIKADDISLAGGIVVELTVADTVDLDAALSGASLASFQARLDTEAVPLPFADGDGDGTFTATFLFLIPGDHEASVELQDGVTFTFTTSPELAQTVTVGSGEQVTVSFEVTSAAAASGS